MKSTDYSRTVEVFKGSPWEAELVKGLLENNGKIGRASCRERV